MFVMTQKLGFSASCLQILRQSALLQLHYLPIRSTYLPSSPSLRGHFIICYFLCRYVAYAEYTYSRTTNVYIFEWPSDTGDTKTPISRNRRRRVVGGIENPYRSPITHLSFTQDNKFLLVALGAPEATVLYVAWDRGSEGKVLAAAHNVSPYKLSHVDASPYDASLVAITGRDVLRWYRYSDDAGSAGTFSSAAGSTSMNGQQAGNSNVLPLKNIPLVLGKRESHIFTCHSWLPEDRFIAGTSTGDIWLIEGTELKRILNPPDRSFSFSMTNVGSLMAFTKGFLVGCNDGVLAVYEKSEDARDYYKTTRMFSIGTIPGTGVGPDKGLITSLSSSVNEEDLVVVTSTGKAYTFKLAAYELSKSGEKNLFRPLVSPMHSIYRPPTKLLSNEADGDAISSAPKILNPFLSESIFNEHFNAVARQRGQLALFTGPTASNLTLANAEPEVLPAILDVDICLRKPIFVTCGADKTIRLWNFTGSSLAANMISNGQFGGLGLGVEAGPFMENLSGADAFPTPVLELSHSFNEIPTAVAIHPSGFIIAVALETRVLLCSVTLECLRVVKDYPLRHCCLIRFSPNGGHFAAASGTSISVISTHTCATFTVLQGHSDRVTCFAWTSDSSSIISASKDGFLLRFPIITPNAISGSASASATQSQAIRGGIGGFQTTSAAAFSAYSNFNQSSTLSSSSHNNTPVTTQNLTVNCGEGIPLTLAIGPGDREVYVSMIPHPPKERERDKDKPVRSVSFATGDKDEPVKKSTASTRTKEGAVLRVIDLAASGHEMIKHSFPTGADPIRALTVAPQSKLLLGGMGHLLLTSQELEACANGLALPSAPGALPATNGSNSNGGANGAAGTRKGWKGGDNGAAMGYMADGSVGPAGGSWAKTSGGAMTTGGTKKNGASNGGSRMPFSASSLVLPRIDLGGSLRALRLPLPQDLVFLGDSSSSTSPNGTMSGTLGSSLVTSNRNAGNTVALPGPNLEVPTFLAHGSSIIRLVISPDERTCLSVSSEGSIGLWSIRQDDPFSPRAAAVGTATTPATNEKSLPWADEVLVTRSDLEAVRLERAQLESTLNELSVAQKYSQRQREQIHLDKLAEAEDKFSEDLIVVHESLEAVRAAKVEAEQRCEEAAFALEARQEAELESLEKIYEAKMENEYHRYEKLLKSCEKANEIAQEQLDQLIKEQAKEKETVLQRYAEDIKAEEDMIKLYEKEYEDIRSEAKEISTLLEEDADVELEDARARYESKVASETKATLLLRGANGVMKRKTSKLNDELRELKELTRRKVEEARVLSDTISALHKDVAGHRKEIRDREDALTEKDARIGDLKKKNQELEKFKFVLNYKVQELKRQILPRKREITELRTQLQDMEGELLQYHKSNAALDLMISELRLKRDGIANEYNALCEELEERNERLRDIEADVASIAALGGNIRTVRPAMIRLYARYIHKEKGTLTGGTDANGRATEGGTGAYLVPIAQDENDATLSASRTGLFNNTKRLGSTLQAIPEDFDADSFDNMILHLPVGVSTAEVAEEVARTRDHLGRAVANLKAQISKEQDVMTTDVNRLMREQTVLTKELNALRRELKYQEAELEKLMRGQTATPASRASASIKDIDSEYQSIMSSIEGDRSRELDSMEESDFTFDTASLVEKTDRLNFAKTGPLASVSEKSRASKSDQATIGTTLRTLKTSSAPNKSNLGTNYTRVGSSSSQATATTTMKSRASIEQTSGPKVSARRTAALLGVVEGSGVAISLENVNSTMINPSNK